VKETNGVSENMERKVGNCRFVLSLAILMQFIPCWLTLFRVGRISTNTKIEVFI